MDFRQRLEKSRMHLVDSDPKTDKDTISTYFATDRSGLPICIELRLNTGSSKAIPYSMITEINFDVDGGIELLTNMKQIHIGGRNLKPLYEILIQHRVKFVQPDSGTDLQEDGIFVKEISVTER